MLKLSVLYYILWNLSSYAAIFFPSTVTDLINDINIANSNNSDDIIDLGGHTFILTAINNITDGNNGLPSILSDGGHNLLITNGTIERDPTALGFRFIRVDTLANLSITDVAFLRGLADNDDFSQFPGNGGGAILNRGTLTIQYSSFVNNTSTTALIFGDAGGGALYNYDGTILLIESTLFLNNKSTQDFGGAIISQNTISVINNSSFIDNSAGVGGGAIGNFSSIATISNSTFFDNTAGDGGAILNGISASINTIINSTFFGNTAIGGPFTSAFGGAISIASSNIDNILNSTFSSNSAYEQGGAISNFGGTIGNLESTIVAKDSAPINPDISNTAGGVIINASFNLIGTDQGHSILNGVNNNQVGTLASPLDPLLSAPANNGGLTLTSALLPNSPALNSGSNPNSLLFDQRGYGYFRSIGQTDIGAFELQVCP